MNIPDELKALAKPGEKAIVCNPDSGSIHFSDFAPLKTYEDGPSSLTDIVDSNQDTNVLLVTSMAMRSPGLMAESPDCLFRGSAIHLRVVYFDSPEPRIFCS